MQEEKELKKKHLEPPRLSEHVSLIDSHCHLDMDGYKKDLDDVLSRALAANVHHVITIGIDLKSSKKAVELARRYPFISATVGVHPHDVDNSDAHTYEALAGLVAKEREHIVAYGEIGLDYVKQYSEIENQKIHFRSQLEMAKELALPVIIHDREAHADTIRILKESGIQTGGIMHCFSGDMEFAKQVLDLGLLISIPGVVTFKNAVSIQDVAKNVPLDALLVETDGPFLSPHPFRGKRNEPAYVAYTADYIAKLRGISLDEFAAATTRNCCRLFDINISKQSH